MFIINWLMERVQFPNEEALTNTRVPTEENTNLGCGRHRRSLLSMNHRLEYTMSSPILALKLVRPGGRPVVIRTVRRR